MVSNDFVPGEKISRGGDALSGKILKDKVTVLVDTDQITRLQLLRINQPNHWQEDSLLNWEMQWFWRVRVVIKREGNMYARNTDLTSGGLDHSRLALPLRIKIHSPTILLSLLIRIQVQQLK